MVLPKVLQAGEHGHAGFVFLGEVCLKWCRNHEGHCPDLTRPSGGAFSLRGDHSQTGLSMPSLLSWRSTHTPPVSTQENLASVTLCSSPDVSRVSPPPPRNLGPPSRGAWGRFRHGYRLVTLHQDECRQTLDISPPLPEDVWAVGTGTSLEPHRNS